MTHDSTSGQEMDAGMTLSLFILSLFLWCLHEALPLVVSLVSTSSRRTPCEVGYALAGGWSNTVNDEAQDSPEARASHRKAEGRSRRGW